MIIRIATLEEMKELWGYSNSNTYNYFVDGINSGNIEFWTVEDSKAGELVGELYIFWDSEDKNEADGATRAYLCALRIKKTYQGLGLSSKLMAAKSLVERKEKVLLGFLDELKYELADTLCET